jgi:NDP-sugar pyrophosphorylase family protein
VKEGDYKSTLILVEDAYLSFQVLMNLYQQMREEKKSGIEQPSTISDSAILGEEVYIGAHTYISEMRRVQSLDYTAAHLLKQIEQQNLSLQKIEMEKMKYHIHSSNRSRK